MHINLMCIIQFHLYVYYIILDYLKGSGLKEFFYSIERNQQMVLDTKYEEE